MEHDPSSYVATREERERAASNLSLLATACWVVGAAVETSATRGVLVSGLSPERVNAAGVVQLLRAVSNDHLEAIVELLRGSRPKTSSVATLIRSCTETWGRALWLMSAPSPTQAEYRVRALVLKELQTAQVRGVSMLSGEAIDIAIQRATLDRDALAGSTVESIPGYTKLAVDLLARAGAPNPSTIYSHLSGIAHGEVIFVSSLTRDPLGGSRLTLDLPSRNLASYCNWIVAVTCLGIFTLFEHWDLPRNVQGAFAKVVLEVTAALPADPSADIA